MKAGKRTLISWVCRAARESKLVNHTVVAWAHKFPHLNENNVLERFREVVKRFEPNIVVRLTSDCPLLTGRNIDLAIEEFKALNTDYYSNHLDGFDVQVFKPELLWTRGVYDTEHVISDFTTQSTGLSVNTLEELERVRAIICATR